MPHVTVVTRWLRRLPAARNSANDEGDALMVGLHRLQARKVAKTKRSPYLCVRPSCCVRDHEQGWHKSLSNVPVKMCWDVEACVLVVEAEDGDVTASTTKKSRPLFVATVPLTGQPHTGNERLHL